MTFWGRRWIGLCLVIVFYFAGSPPAWSIRPQAPVGSSHGIVLDPLPVPPPPTPSVIISTIAQPAPTGTSTSQSRGLGAQTSTEVSDFVSYFNSHPQLLNVSETPALRLDYAHTVPGLSGLRTRTYVHLVQTVQGIDVAETDVSFSYDPSAQPRTFDLIHSRLYPEIASAVVSLPSEQNARARLIERAGSTRLESQKAKVRWIDGQWQGLQEYSLEYGLHAGVNASGKAYVWDDRIYATYSGQAAGRGVAFNPLQTGNALTTIPLQDLMITDSTSAPTYTDLSGNYIFSTTSTNTITVGLSGRWGKVVDLNNTTSVTTLNTTVPGILFNSTGNNEFQTAQTNAYVHEHIVHNYIKSHGVNPQDIDFPLTVNVNDSETCNAFYGFNTINFFRSDGTCLNSAYDTIIYHEYGHFIDDVIGGLTDRGLSEGWGDIMATYISGQPSIGEGFYEAPNTEIRNGVNNYIYHPGDEVHKLGQAWMGFAWDLRNNLISSLGQTNGTALAEDLVLPVFWDNSPNIPLAVRAVALRDSPDQDPTHGPHYQQILSAANHHGVAFIFTAVPEFTWDTPLDGTTVQNTVSILVTATDALNTRISPMTLSIDSTPVASANTSAINYTWDTSQYPNGPHVMSVRAQTSDGRSNSISRTFIVKNFQQLAAYDPTLKAPVCATAGAVCDSGALLNGRSTINGGNEPNQPNTLFNSCSDGTSGSYHSDESLDRLKVSTVDGQPFAAGKQVKIDATAWVYGTNVDYLDLYYTASAASPSWNFIGTLKASTNGLQTISATYTLPPGDLQAIRGRFRYGGTPSPCGAGTYDDVDDLVFAITPAAPPPPPPPDLTVSLFTLSPSTLTPNAPFSMSVFVQNLSSGPATTPVALQVYVDTSTFASWSALISSIPANGVSVVTFSGNAPSSPRLHAYHAVVTTTQTETNVSNNDKYAYLTVSTGPSTDTYLSDLPWKSVTSTATVRRDLTLFGNPIKLNGTMHPKGLAIIAPTDIVFPLPLNQQCAFVTSAGIDDETGLQGSANFSAYMDSTQFYNSGPLKGGDPSQTIASEVTNSQQLLLRVTDTPGFPAGSHGDWASARLHCNITQDTSAPVVSGIVVTYVSTIAVQITWTTNELSNSWVDYGPTTSYGFIGSDFNASLSHIIVLTGFAPGFYHFKVRSSDPFNNVGFSGDLTFDDTPPVPPAPLAPFTLVLGQATSSSLMLSWNASTGPVVTAGYRLDVSLSSSFLTFVSGYQNKDIGNVTSTLLSGLTAQTSYFARLRAYNSALLTSSSSLVAQGTTLVAPPPVVTPAIASYDSTFKAPACLTSAISCDSASLLIGRGPIGPEPNQPNTIFNSCGDGNSGTFHRDESLDRLKVATLDGLGFAAGKTVTIEASVWVYSQVDRLDLFYTANANSPVWTPLITLAPTGTGLQTLSATYVLPTGTLQAIRGVFRYGGTASPCNTSSYNDTDDLIFAVGTGPPPPPPDTTSPTVEIAYPTNGTTLQGSITMSGTASDNIGVISVAIAVDGQSQGNATGTTAWNFSLNSKLFANGTHQLKATAFDAASNQSSTTTQVTINNPVGPPSSDAVYDPIFKTALCSVAGTVCDSGSLFVGRGSMTGGIEPNQPNTLFNSCSDGSAGNFHVDESNDRIKITSVTGQTFAPGKTILIEATVWAYSGFQSDHLDLYYAANANSPTWVYLTTLNPTSGGQQTLSTTMVIPNGGSWQAVRANFRYSGSPSECPSGVYMDHDDLVFAVAPGVLGAQASFFGNNQPSIALAPTVSQTGSVIATVRVHPNPFRLSRGDQVVTFDQMTNGSSVKLFTVSGRFVKELRASGTSVAWDLTNDSGDHVASGLYLYLVTDPLGNISRGKLAVIR